MKKVGLLYGAKGGNTESVAKRIYQKFEESDIEMMCISDVTEQDLLNYDHLIFGVSTVGAETWDAANPTNAWDSLFPKLKGMDLSGKKFAIFGLGNQIQWPDHFVDDMAVVFENISSCGAELVGKWSVKGYEYNESKAQVDDHFYGLAVDEDHQDEMTDERIDQWTKLIKKEFGI